MNKLNVITTVSVVSVLVFDIDTDVDKPFFRGVGATMFFRGVGATVVADSTHVEFELWC